MHTDQVLLLTTFSRQMAEVLRDVPGADDAAGADIYSAFAEVFPETFTVALLRGLDDDAFVRLAAAFNDYFETDAITPAHLRTGIAATLWHWDDASA